MDECPECGSTQVVVQPHDGALVSVCALCGAVHGAAEAVAGVRAGAEAQARGIDPAIFPLVQVLDGLPGCRVIDSSAGGRSGPPFVAFTLYGAAGLRTLENLTRSLELGRGGRRRPWSLQLEPGAGVVFALRPHAGSTEDIVAARADLPVLVRELVRNSQLSWWHR